MADDANDFLISCADTVAAFHECNGHRKAKASNQYIVLSQCGPVREKKSLLSLRETKKLIKETVCYEDSWDRS